LPRRLIDNCSLIRHVEVAAAGYVASNWLIVSRSAMCSNCARSICASDARAGLNVAASGPDMFESLALLLNGFNTGRDVAFRVMKPFE
jgi:hypothetical protein